MKRFVVATLIAALCVPARTAIARDLLTFAHEYHETVGAWWDPFFTCESFCFSQVLVYARSDDGLRSVTFAAPAPACLNNPAVFQFVTPYRVVAGDIATGITVAFDSCLVTKKNSNGYPIEDIYVGTIQIATVSPITCCAFFPLPALPARRIQGTDCNGNIVVLRHQGVTFNFEWYQPGCGVPSVPYGESPMNGAVVPGGVVTLDWDSGTSAGTNLGEFRQDMMFGTDPDHLTRIGYNVSPPYGVGPLNWGTTYYWQVGTMTDFGGSSGPVWKFSTEVVTPAEPATWGKIKGLFRQKRN